MLIEIMDALLSTQMFKIINAILVIIICKLKYQDNFIYQKVILIILKIMYYLNLSKANLPIKGNKSIF